MVRLPAISCDAFGTLDDNDFQWLFQQSVVAMAEHETNNYEPQRSVLEVGKVWIKDIDVCVAAEQKHAPKSPILQRNRTCDVA